jgi:hypothetical protein
MFITSQSHADSVCAVMRPCLQIHHKSTMTGIQQKKRFATLSTLCAKSRILLPRFQSATSSALHRAHVLAIPATQQSTSGVSKGASLNGMAFRRAEQFGQGHSCLPTRCGVGPSSTFGGISDVSTNTLHSPHVTSGHAWTCVGTDDSGTARMCVPVRNGATATRDCRNFSPTVRSSGSDDSGTARICVPGGTGTAATRLYVRRILAPLTCLLRFSLPDIPTILPDHLTHRAPLRRCSGNYRFNLCVLDWLVQPWPGSLPVCG